MDCAPTCITKLPALGPVMHQVNKQVVQLEASTDDASYA